MIGKMAGGFLEQIAPLLESGDVESVANVLSQAYEGFVGTYRPLLLATSKVSEQVAADLAPVLSTVLKVVNDTANDETLQGEMARFRQLRAKGRKKALDAYISAGFTKQEAMSLILADIASLKEATKSISRSSSSK